jgi:predicted RNase H-like nuclease (RuvC/YqgF family)
MLQQLWSSKSEIQQLRSLNSEMIGEITSLKSTLNKQSKASMSEKSPNRRQVRITEKIINPVVTQLDNMKSSYKSKLVSISQSVKIEDNSNSP